MLPGLPPAAWRAGEEGGAQKLCGRSGNAESGLRLFQVGEGEQGMRRV